MSVQHIVLACAVGRICNCDWKFYGALENARLMVFDCQEMVLKTDHLLYTKIVFTTFCEGGFDLHFVQISIH